MSLRRRIRVYCNFGGRECHWLRHWRHAKTSEFLKNSEVLSAAVSKAMMRLGVSYTKAINKQFKQQQIISR